MKQLRGQAQGEAFTLIELLVVVAIIAFIGWLMIIPANSDRYRYAAQARCGNNQKQIAIGFATWASDNEDKFPWQVSTNDDGTMELISNSQAAPQFHSLSNLVREPQLFVCPTDKIRLSVSNYISFGNSNISYFVNVDVTVTNGAAIMTGDRNLQAGNNPVKPGLFVYTNGMEMTWTRELHEKSSIPLGVISFGNGHVESVPVYRAKVSKLTEVFDWQKLANVRLLVP